MALANRDRTSTRQASATISSRGSTVPSLRSQRHHPMHNPAGRAVGPRCFPAVDAISTPLGLRDGSKSILGKRQWSAIEELIFAPRQRILEREQYELALELEKCQIGGSNKIPTVICSEPQGTVPASSSRTMEVQTEHRTPPDQISPSRPSTPPQVRTKSQTKSASANRASRNRESPESPTSASCGSPCKSLKKYFVTKTFRNRSFRARVADAMGIDLTLEVGSDLPSRSTN